LKTATTLAQETKWLNREMGRVLVQSSLADECPVRIHSRETDAGGAPEWHPSFERWIDAERDETPRTKTRFYESDHKMHPQRLKRALRQVRKLAPREYDALYLMIALKYTWGGARTKMNEDNLRRGQAEYSEAEFLVLTVSGSSLLLASY
jgi:hypothetical protein